MTGRRYPARVVIRDVGPRDGLQPEAPVAVEDRVRLVDALLAAGVRHVEVAAFVSPKAVPAMAGAGDVVAGVARPRGVTVAALVPNLRGAQLALATGGVDELTVTISASETYNQRNVHMSTAESEAAIADIVAAASAGPDAGAAEPDAVPGAGAGAGPGAGAGAGAGAAAASRDGGAVPVDAVISCAFGSPYEGDLPPADIVALAGRLRAAGVTTVTYADTTGMATPRRVDDLLDALVADGGPAALEGIGLHLHDTRGLALANAYAALERGVARFDTAVGGLGGSPFAHGAGGNLATESLVALLDDLGVDTGIDLAGLIEAAALVGELVGRPVPSPIAHHGPPRP